MKRPIYYSVFWDGIHKEYVACTTDYPNREGRDRKPERALKLLRKDLKRHE